MSPIRCSAPIDSIGAALEAAVAELDSTSTSARLDAEILLGQVLGKNRAFLRAWPETRLNTVQINHFRELIEARKNGMPIAYLCGYKEFWSGNFKVSPDVLIPRHETELLIEMALEIIPRGRPVSVLELGTGSGIIAVSLAMERPGLSILVTDISSAALEIARENVKQHRVGAIQFLTSNWFESIPQTKYDLLVSNPPYVADDDPHLTLGDLVFEPEIALKSGPSGFEALKLIADRAREWLSPGGHLLLEHGFQQASGLSHMLHRFGYRSITTCSDLQGHPRAARALWPGQF
ncbi:MAG: peptide chain release factor N(5)-glutamine methyltransferase [Methylococcales bacterium]